MLFVGGAAILVAIVIGTVVLAVAGDDGGGDALEGVTPVVSSSLQNTVDVVDNDFEPRELTVRPGTRVTWRFEGNDAHDVTEDRGAFESGTMTEGDEYVLTFEDPGTFYYYCTLHHSMQGTIIVAPP